VSNTCPITPTDEGAASWADPAAGAKSSAKPAPQRADFKIGCGHARHQSW
jgi:hypothetical protein